MGNFYLFGGVCYVAGFATAMAIMTRRVEKLRRVLLRGVTVATEIKD